MAVHLNDVYEHVVNLDHCCPAECGPWQRLKAFRVADRCNKVLQIRRGATALKIFIGHR